MCVSRVYSCYHTFGTIVISFVEVVVIGSGGATLHETLLVGSKP